MNDIVPALREIADRKGSFYLSELAENVDEAYKQHKAHFFDLDLYCTREGNDYHLRKISVESLGRIGDISELLPGKLPANVEAAIESYIKSKFGRGWNRGDSGQRLREAVMRQKERYWSAAAGKYSALDMAAYLLYHFPVYFCQFQYLLYDLLAGGLLKNKICMADIGAGPGTITLAAMDFFSRLAGTGNKGNPVPILLKIVSVERSEEAIGCYRHLTSELGTPNVLIEEPRRESVLSMKSDLPTDVDLVVFSNVLSELGDNQASRARAVTSLLKNANSNVTVMLIEPADRTNSTRLRATQGMLMRKGFTLYSPCTMIWGRACQPDNCWSFEDFGSIEAPGFMKKIAGAGEPYKYMNTDMKASYAILRKDGTVKRPYRAMRTKFMPLSQLSKNTGKVVNIAVAIMSSNIGDELDLLYKICDGSTPVPCYLAAPRHHLSGSRKDILRAGYGDIVEVYCTLVRYNKKHNAYNMLVTGSTEVRLVV
ncbi:MAG TPA: hypothetical protein HA257_07120 [Candidatus Methanoperedenaceae archaeon]|nr:hypothetical protein [Candidatus Methanoperedenaceae archaeon]